jgi:hypothetical protein
VGISAPSVEGHGRPPHFYRRDSDPNMEMNSNRGNVSLIERAGTVSVRPYLKTEFSKKARRQTKLCTH